jgi:hypothetical protein
MKALLLSFLIISLTAFSVKEIKADKVYICVSSGATVYHQKKTCRGLGSCKHEIKEVTEKEAIDDYGRRKCKICY